MSHSAPSAGSGAVLPVRTPPYHTSVPSECKVRKVLAFNTPNNLILPAATGLGVYGGGGGTPGVMMLANGTRPALL